MSKDPNLVRKAYNLGVTDARQGLDILMDGTALDSEGLTDYADDYRRGADDAHALDKILGRGRWIDTNA